MYTRSCVFVCLCLFAIAACGAQDASKATASYEPLEGGVSGTTPHAASSPASSTAHAAAPGGVAAKVDVKLSPELEAQALHPKNAAVHVYKGHKRNFAKPSAPAASTALRGEPPAARTPEAAPAAADDAPGGSAAEAPMDAEGADSETTEFPVDVYEEVTELKRTREQHELNDKVPKTRTTEHANLKPADSAVGPKQVLPPHAQARVDAQRERDMKAVATSKLQSMRMHKKAKQLAGPPAMEEVPDTTPPPSQDAAEEAAADPSSAPQAGAAAAAAAHGGAQAGLAAVAGHRFVVGSGSAAGLGGLHEAPAAFASGRSAREEEYLHRRGYDRRTSGNLWWNATAKAEAEAKAAAEEDAQAAEEEAARTPPPPPMSIFARTHQVKDVAVGSYEWDPATMPEDVGLGFAVFVVGSLNRADMDRVYWCLESACLAHPGAQMFVMTDETTDFEFLEQWEARHAAAARGGDGRLCTLDVRRSDGIGSRKREALMRDRLEEERDLLRDLARRPAPLHLVFMDSDDLFTGSVREVFSDKQFDVALATRLSEALPVLMNVKFVHGARLAAASALWDEALLLWNSECTACDRVAFHRAIKANAVDFDPNRFPAGVKGGFAWDLWWDTPGGSALILQFMPCNVYSAVPGGSGWELCVPKPDSRVLHFKGKLKMKETKYFQMVSTGKANKAVQMAIDESDKKGKKSKKRIDAINDRFITTDPWQPNPLDASRATTSSMPHSRMQAMRPMQYMEGAAHLQDQLQSQKGRELPLQAAALG